MPNVDYWFIFPLALLGAIVANATGAGGGVVFVPAFHMLGISPDSIIATSFAIQCFGMTAGTLAWHRLAKQKQKSDDITERETWGEYLPLIYQLALPALIGVIIGQTLLQPESASQVKNVFKVFSFIFGLAILSTTYAIWRRRHLTPKVGVLSPKLRFAASFTSLIGGVITAWLSIGVGELLAVLFILMRFPVRFAIGVAVSISAVSVWVGVQKYLWLEPTIDVQVLMFAAPAAVLGGTVAKYLVSFFSPTQLKIFIATWILISAVAM